MTLFRGQAGWAKMILLGGKLRALACHPTKKVNKAEKLTYLSTNKRTSLFWEGSKKFYKTVPQILNIDHLRKKLPKGKLNQWLLSVQQLREFSIIRNGGQLDFYFESVFFSFYTFFKLKNIYLFKYFSKK
jgi:hypothetical protein